MQALASTCGPGNPRPGKFPASTHHRMVVRPWHAVHGYMCGAGGVGAQYRKEGSVGAGEGAEANQGSRLEIRGLAKLKLLKLVDLDSFRSSTRAALP
jgi:hypothetical protein